MNGANLIKISLLVFFSCTHVDYLIQKPVKINNSDSKVRLLINDDEVKRERYYPDTYLFFYFNDVLLAKYHKSLSRDNRYENTFFAYFDECVNVKSGKSKLKVIYVTYRNNEQKVLTFEKEMDILSGQKIIIYYNKGFSIKDDSPL